MKEIMKKIKRIKKIKAFILLIFNFLNNYYFH